MIPELPKSVTDIERLAFYSDLLSNLEDQSSIHTNWHTHKQNPAVCWICDIPILARKIAYIVEKNITKSTDRHSDSYSSENDSDTEIDNESLNRDEELVKSYEADLQAEELDIESNEESDE